MEAWKASLRLAHRHTCFRILKTSFIHSTSSLSSSNRRSNLSPQWNEDSFDDGTGNFSDEPYHAASNKQQTLNIHKNHGVNPSGREQILNRAHHNKRDKLKVSSLPDWDFYDDEIFKMPSGRERRKESGMSNWDFYDDDGDTFEISPKNERASTRDPGYCDEEVMFEMSSGRFCFWENTEPVNFREQKSWKTQRKTYNNKTEHAHRAKTEDTYNTESSNSFQGTIYDRMELGLSIMGPLQPEDVKKAFHACALQWHPDRHEGPSKDMASEKFKRCCSAYQSLCKALVTS